MEITVNRLHQSARSTTGVLEAEGKLFCYTLEPAAPIPAGRYELVKYHSPDHGCDVLMLTGVPGHAYVEIHAGNYPQDTRNCLLPGNQIGKDYVGNSRAATSAFYALFFRALQAGKVWITYKNLF